MNYELFLVIAGLSSFAFILLYVFKLKPDLEVEIARARIFDLRYKWFDIASSGQIDRDSELYRKVESDLNLLLRHMHRISVANLLAVYFTEKISGASPSNSGPSIKSILASIKSEELKKVVGQIYVESAQVMLACLINRSFFLQLAVRTLVLFFRVQATLNKKHRSGGVVVAQRASATPDLNLPGSSQVVSKVKNSLNSKAKAELMLEEVLMRAEAA